MNIRQYEREEGQIDQDYNEGRISNEEHTKLVNELWRDYRDAAQEAAMEAYKRELGEW